jgi:hypothetical protein
VVSPLQKSLATRLEGVNILSLGKVDFADVDHIKDYVSF